MHRKRELTNDDIKRAVLIFNSKHRKYKIIFDEDSNFFTFIDKENNYKCFITIPKVSDINEVIEIFEDLRKDLL